MKRLLGLCLLSSALVAGWIWPTSALALPFGATSNVAPSSFVSNGGSLTGSFTVDPSLLQYGVAGAQVKFNFSDDNDVLYAGTSTGSYNYDYGQPPNTYYLRSIYTYYSDAPEQASVSVGDQGGSASSSYYQQNQYLNRNYDGEQSSFWYSYLVCSWGCHVVYVYQNNYYFTDNYTQTYGYTGDFDIMINLDSTGLTELASSGILNFTVSSGTGDFFLDSATLTGMANDPPSAVPEPTSFLLLVSGLAGLGGFAWRRHRKS
jgi:hypothetical protein